ncbi:hypothetical protein HY229_00885 [Candidatus Acetothermia bacterium]|nr:hypothetical protein [Candidatus Acetothermia bacterium]MBI3642646.1 hypothetical protein [Candidatus Acetothermia bacterium]
MHRRMTVCLIAGLWLLAGIAWNANLFSFSLPCLWPDAASVSPIEGASNLSLTPNLKVEEHWPLGIAPPNACSHNKTQWEVGTGTQGSTAFDMQLTGITYDSGDSASLDLIAVPSGRLGAGQLYYWRYQFKDGNSADDSGWYDVSSFRTSSSPSSPSPSSCLWPYITGQSPASGTTGVSLTPTLSINAPASGGSACTHESSQWQIAKDSSFSNLVYDSGFVGAPSLNSITIPQGMLVSSTTYWWRMREQTTGAISSSWAANQSFTTQLLIVAIPLCFWPSITNNSPADGAGDLSLTPTLSVTTTGLVRVPACSHAKSQWQIASDASFNSMVYDSGESVSDLTSITLPSGQLAAGTLYYWRARFIADNDQISDWSATTSFSTALTIVPPGPCHWPVVHYATPAPDATNVSLTPMLQISVTAPTLLPACEYDSIVWLVAVRNPSGPGITNVLNETVAGVALSKIIPAGLLHASTRYAWAVSLRKSSDNTSHQYDPVAFTTGAAEGGTTQPPTGSQSLTSFDTNHDCILEDTEFFAVIDLWIANQVENALFFQAVDAWIGQTRLCPAASSVVPSSAVRVEMSAGQGIAFSSHLQSVAAMSLDIIDPAGRIIVSESAQANHLRWNLTSRDGLRVANGVYYYRVRIFAWTGQLVSTGALRPLMILR